jgi:nitroimidazol reductase NimA-like FMN-containing flavoprotein (pyridoxamine 5'-phosphate oxidase superfamily)
MQKRPEKPSVCVRRKDRLFTEDAWLDQLLATAALGQFALVWEGKPLIHTSLFWYDGTDIFWHTAAAGKLASVLEQGECDAVFTVSELGRILPAATPFAFSAEYASVVCHGVAHTVRETKDKRRVLEGIMAKYAPHLSPGTDYAPMPERDVAIPNVYRLAVTARTASTTSSRSISPGFHTRQNRSSPPSGWQAA